ncbi:PREDICTED: V-set and transmembrane domain-containing protein 2-like protein [Aptenodytes forsteri]|uniref:V-set and transmembrane domain-containing protein 2-like protein n=1 Tax=Aptenodytes forsteri TaxID=9233 RepID=UPI000905026B|nr:PREDICTED: V-set and transmembrane domain-containing protein 2-like protein [Aptenodytes forsteri]
MATLSRQHRQHEVAGKEEGHLAQIQWDPDLASWQGSMGRLAALGLAMLAWRGSAPRPRAVPCQEEATADSLFTETPHDMTAQAGEDVEMACSFRGSGSPSYSLEIQWWYVRNHKDWMDKQTWASNQLKASLQEEPGKDATKISVVKVVGSNISHKLRLGGGEAGGAGGVIDSSDGKARHHKVKAYLRVEAAGGVGHPQDTQLRDAPLLDPAVPGSAHVHHHHHHHKAGKELKKRSADTSCVL